MTQPRINPTPEDIVSSLGQSERFPAGSDAFKVIAPHMGQLIEIIGSRMHDQVGLSNWLGVTAEFTRYLAQNDEFLSGLDELMERPMVVMLYDNLAGQMEAVARHTEQFLADHGITEMQALESSSLPEYAKRLIRDGDLTFAVMLIQTPEAFIQTGS